MLPLVLLSGPPTGREAAAQPLKRLWAYGAFAVQPCSFSSPMPFTTTSRESLQQANVAFAVEGQCRLHSARAVAAENLGTLPRQELFSQLLVLSLLLLFSHFGIVRRHACGFCPPLRFLALNAQRCFARTRRLPCRWCAWAKRLAISAASSG